jgi:hypothetical protein
MQARQIAVVNPRTGEVKLFQVFPERKVFSVTSSAIYGEVRTDCALSLHRCKDGELLHPEDEIGLPADGDLFEIVWPGGGV